MSDRFLGYFEVCIAILCFGFTGFGLSELIRHFNLFPLMLLLFIFGYGVLALYAGVKNFQ